MSIKDPNLRAQVNNETGLGTNTALNGGRFFNKDGVPNIEVCGLPLLRRLNIYHSLLSMSRWKFLATIILFFVAINLVFCRLVSLDRHRSPGRHGGG
jgi:inward rectifier potassium channel